MKKLISNIVATTGITLLVLSGIALCYGAMWLRIDGIFQALLANILIHIGFLVFDRLDYSYPILESVVKVGYTVAIVLLSGWIFGWYGNLPIWCLIFMTIVTYVGSVAISAISMLEEVKSINVLLKNRN